MSPIKFTFNPLIIEYKGEVDYDLSYQECPCEDLITRIADYVEWFFKR